MRLDKVSDALITFIFEKGEFMLYAPKCGGGADLTMLTNQVVMSGTHPSLPYGPQTTM